MTNHIRINSEALRSVAARHEEVADVVARSRLAGANIEAVLCSYGPIMNQTKAAATNLLRLRDAELRAHDTRHRAAASRLRQAAANFTATEDLNAERLRLE
jgi:hypothetical protein